MSIPKRRKGTPAAEEDEEIFSDQEQIFDFDDADTSDGDDGSSGSDKEVTAAQKRLKMAQAYLHSLRSSARPTTDDNNTADGDDGEIDAEAMDREIIAGRLQQDTLMSRGRAFEALAAKYEQSAVADAAKVFKVNTPDGRVPTACCASADGHSVYLATKSRFIYHYALVPESEGALAYRRVHTFKAPEKFDRTLSLALSSCGQSLAAGSHSGRIAVWSIKAKPAPSQKEAMPQFSYKFEGEMAQHRGPVYALAFRRDALSLFSAAADRTIKQWSLESHPPAYVDTLFGHQDCIMGLAALGRETCVSVGARDRTARFWKLVDETQLVFRPIEAAGGSLDCVAMLDEESFVTGSDSGAVSLFCSRKKKPLEWIQLDSHMGAIEALAVVPYSDLLAIGCSNGCVSIVSASPATRSIVPVAKLPITGAATALSWDDQGKVLAVAVGKESRAGRWTVNKDAKNCLLIYRFF